MTRQKRPGNTPAADVVAGRLTKQQVLAGEAFAHLFAVSHLERLAQDVRLDLRKMLAEVAAEVGRFDFIILREVAVHGQSIKQLAVNLYGPADVSRRRQTLSPRTRFEVLKRDNFTCRYCGRRAPEVVLHCDHIVAFIRGGDDAASNLVTACEDCNMGKSDVPLDGEPHKRPAARGSRKGCLGALSC